MLQKDDRMLQQKLTGIIMKSLLRHKFVKIERHAFPVGSFPIP